MKYQVISSLLYRVLLLIVVAMLVAIVDRHLLFQVAFYYAWLGFLTISLVWPSLLGLALQIYLFVTGFTWCDTVVS
jgi:hypothetical protein